MILDYSQYNKYKGEDDSGTRYDDAYTNGQINTRSENKIKKFDAITNAVY